MAGFRAFLRLSSAPPSTSGWRGVLLLGVVAAIVAALPEARALLSLGLLGGLVLGGLLILIRQQPRPRGPRRGTPIVLFPRPVTQVSDLLTRSQVATVSLLA